MPWSNQSIRLLPLWIYTALKLPGILPLHQQCLLPLWIYTALKPCSSCSAVIVSLLPLWIYTALKRRISLQYASHGLLPLWIYTALKLFRVSVCIRLCLLPLWIYTALKHAKQLTAEVLVCYPYEFTLLSNYYSEPFDDFEFVTPMNLHCSQTLSDERQKRLMFVTPMNLHCSQTIKSLSTYCSSLLPLWIYTALKPQTVQE